MDLEIKPGAGIRDLKQFVSFPYSLYAENRFWVPPLRFAELYPEGMLVEGFKELGTMETIYNFPYYPVHLEKNGYQKDVDWVEFEVSVPESVHEKLKRLADIAEIIVDFEMHLPWPFANSKYSTGNILSRLENNEYEVRWYLVRSDSLIDSKGTVRFIPYGKKTLLKYQSFIHPSSKLASIFCSKAESGITKTVRAIVTYTEGIKKKNPEKMQKLVSALPG